MTSQNSKAALPETCYAPASRQTDDEIREQFNSMIGSPVVDTLLKSIGGFLAILNEQRQILAANENFLKTVGVADVNELLGLRPGEALDCIHSNDGGGCGTSEYCATCGVVVSIMSCLASNDPVESRCCLTLRKGGVTRELYFSVRVFPIIQGGRRLIVLFMQDIADHQRRAVLERAFFSDISGMIAGLLGRSKVLLAADAEKGHLLAEDIFEGLIKLAQEVRVQKSLTQESKGEIFPLLRLTAVADVMQEITKACLDYPLAQGKKLIVEDKTAGFKFKIDAWLLQRVIEGMVLNALEASAAGDEVRLTAEIKHSLLIVSVWNRQCIPEGVRKRIFQQNFTTHPELGRGMGTYFMKVIGEQSLGGKVEFSTSESEGTVFRISLKV